MCGVCNEMMAIMIMIHFQTSQFAMWHATLLSLLSTLAFVVLVVGPHERNGTGPTSLRFSPPLPFGVYDYMQRAHNLRALSARFFAFAFCILDNCGDCARQCATHIFLSVRRVVGDEFVKARRLVWKKPCDRKLSQRWHETYDYYSMWSTHQKGYRQVIASHRVVVGQVHRLVNPTGLCEICTIISKLWQITVPMASGNKARDKIVDERLKEGDSN